MAADGQIEQSSICPTRHPVRDNPRRVSANVIIFCSAGSTNGADLAGVGPVGLPGRTKMNAVNLCPSAAITGAAFDCNTT